MYSFLLAFTLIVGLVSLVYSWLKKQQNYWTDRGIPNHKGSLIKGNDGEFRYKKHLSVYFKELYEEFKDKSPLCGFTLMTNHFCVALDVDLIKDILITEFQTFENRGLYFNEKDDPLTGNLFFMDGEKWRTMRHKMSPTFTSGKMKYMFETVVEVGQELRQVFSEKVSESQDNILDVNDLLGRYTADVIGRCAFGLECNSLRDPKAEFVEKGKLFFSKHRHSPIVEAFIFGCKDLARKLGMRIVTQEVHDFYMRIVKETIEYREKNQIKRNDFMDILIEMKNSPNGLTVEEIAAQAFVFFIAGFETSSTTMTYALYEMALNPSIQEKLRHHLNQVFEKHKDHFTYECMKDMDYLNQVIDETLRMHPVLGHLMRTPKAHYNFRDSRFYIPKNQMVIIPTLGLHYDEEFYPEPQVFRPERFTKEAKEARVPCSYLPFGEGPRNCIGLRFGKMQAAIGLALLLRNFKFSVAKETEIPPPLNLESFVMNFDHGLKLKVDQV